jgi:hypothetical protein
MNFMEVTINALRNAGAITPSELDVLIGYTSEKVLQEFCRVNQYYSFNENDKRHLRAIYRNLYDELTKEDKTVDAIAQTHYDKLKLWLEESNPFSPKIYQKKESVLDTVACSEYSAQLQKDILHLGDTQLLNPVLDIGCGKEGNLVNYLREQGFDAYGIDRFAEDSLFLKRADWLSFDYGTEKWGTIVSNLGFSNHFVHNHLRKDGNFMEYARKYMDMLKSLKIGGRFCYAPDLPFIEQYLDEKAFLTEKYDIENLSVKTTVIKRLK